MSRAVPESATITNRSALLSWKGQPYMTSGLRRLRLSRNTDNRKRAFADVVTVDAWHDSFGEDRSRADLHADVTFGIARVGGEAESPVRFRLSVRQAELVVVIPESEPVSVDPKSVNREISDQQGRLIEIVEQAATARAKAGLAASMSATGLGASTSVEAEAEGSISTNKKLEISTNLQFMMVTSSKTADGHYRWLIRPTNAKILEGRPWDVAAQPRLTLLDRRKDRTKSIPPTVRVEVRCRREDLSIEDLEIKNEGIWAAAKRRFGFKNRVAAAESYIRDRLSAEGLEVKNIDDIFGQLTLGSVTAESI